MLPDVVNAVIDLHQSGQLRLHHAIFGPLTETADQIALGKAVMAGSGHMAEYQPDHLGAQLQRRLIAVLTLGHPHPCTRIHRQIGRLDQHLALGEFGHGLSLERQRTRNIAAFRAAIQSPKTVCGHNITLLKSGAA